MGETEEKENAPAADSTTPTNENEEPKETEKLLTKNDNKTNPDEIAINVIKNNEQKLDNDNDQIPKVNGEEITINIPETVKPNEEGREVKPKKIPIGGIKMPGFFTKTKPKNEGDGADNELLDGRGGGGVVNDDTKNDDKAKEAEMKNSRPGFFQSFRFRNPFARSLPHEPLKSDDNDTKDCKNNDTHPQQQQPLNNDPEHETSGTTSQPQKRGLLNAIRLPITNIIPKKLKSTNNTDLELGNGPNNKAGLASMETLDDSLKDTENGKDQTDRSVPITDNADNEVSLKIIENNENKDNKENKEKSSENEKKEAQSCLDRLRAYQCSVDDIAIIGGIIIFIIIVGIICAFTFSGSYEITSAPLRDGKFIKAVTSCGEVEGIFEDSVFAFRGIPYAIPPIGENRWKPAKLIDNIDECWNGTFQAYNNTAINDFCAQVYSNGSSGGTENCLTLDIVTPKVSYDNPVPVIVLIGADTLMGNSPNRLRPSARYARSREVIFVRPNYRMGILGFLATKTLSNSTHPPTSGNYALSDIIAVLKWIQINIEHFGGDPKSVTLFGHRAGGTLVSVLAASQIANQLFNRSWISSSSVIFPGKPLADSEQKNAVYEKELNCVGDIECLKNQSVPELIKHIPDTWYVGTTDLPTQDERSYDDRHEWLVLDGHYLQKHPSEVWSKIDTPPPDMIIGTTLHESHSDKLFMKYAEWTPELIRKHIEESKIGQMNLTDEVLKRYNATYQGLVSLISDIRTICPLWSLRMKHPTIKFYIVTQIGGPFNISDIDSDVQAILGRYEPKTPEQRRYVSAIQQIFYHYVSHGEIKQYDSRKPIIDIGQDALTMASYPNCEFWINNDIVPRYGRLD